MKKRQIIILASSFLLFILMVVWVSFNKKAEKDEENKKGDGLVYYPVVKVQNKTKEVFLTSYGQISSYKSIDINSEVSGKLLKGSIELKPGVKFKKGQLIARVDNTEVLYNLMGRKGGFINLIAQIMPDIKVDFPSEYEKWNKYLKSIKLNEPMPDIPYWNSDKEKILIASKGVLAEYFSIKSMEVNTNKYRIFAPFNGTILEAYLDFGTTVNMGSKIIKIVHTGSFEVKVPMSIHDLEMLKKEKEVEIYTTDDEKIGVGYLTRYTNVINQSTQSLDVYFKITPIEGRELVNGMYINVALRGSEIQNAFALPRRSVVQDSVYVVQDSTLFTKKIKIEKFHGDSVYVTGLKNGDFVVLNSVQSVVDSIKVVGVEK